MPLDSQLAFASIPRIARLYRARKLSPVELTRFLLDRIQSLNPRLNAFLTVTSDLALRQARAAEKELFAPRSRKPRLDRGPLHGIPLSLKDNIHTAGVPTTAGSALLRDFVPSQDAPLVATLKSAGAVLLGKTNMHEFAYGTTSVNPHFGSTRNPWNLDRITGGSSGGSAAAVASGLCFGSIGTDTGGSLRIPAALCGVVGFKPGLNRVSAEGVIPLSPTLDFVGPLARTAADAALLLGPLFARSESEKPLRAVPLERAQRSRLTLAFPREFFLDVLSPEVDATYQRSLRDLESLGFRLKEISLPMLMETEEQGNRIAWPEAAQYHRQAGYFPARSAEYGEDVLTRLELGLKLPAVDYLAALDWRAHFIAAFHRVLAAARVHALVVPTTPIPALPHHVESVDLDGKSWLTRALLLRLNRPANIAGVPAVSVPCGLTSDALPLGLQFIGPHASEQLLFNLASTFEEHFPLAAHPPLET